MAATNYRDEMLAADELDPERRRRRLLQARYNSEQNANTANDLQRQERSAQNPLVDNLGTVIRGGNYNAPPFAMRPAPLVGPPTPLRTGTSPLPTAPPRPSGRIGEVAFDRGPADPAQLEQWVARQLGPEKPTGSPAITPSTPGVAGVAGGTPLAHPPREDKTATSDMNNFGNIPTGINARPQPEMLALNDTEQGRRDLAMLRKQRNLADAALMGSSNRFSKFYNPGQTPDQRAELILSKEGMNQQLGTAQRAANPPRYETDPNSERAVRGRESLTNSLESTLVNEARLQQLPGGQPGPVDTSGVTPRVDAFRDSIAPKAKSPEQMAYEETARNRQQQAVVQANADQGRRDTQRSYKLELDAANRDAELAGAKAAGTIATAGGMRATAEATRAGTDAATAKAQADIANAVLPTEVAREKARAAKDSIPDWPAKIASIAGGIKSASGKAATTADVRTIADGIAQFDALPDEAKKLAAVEILSALEAEAPGLSLDKGVLETSNWRWLNWLTGAGAATETGLVDGNPVGALIQSIGGGQTQMTINQFLAKMRGMRNGAAPTG